MHRVTRELGVLCAGALLLGFLISALAVGGFMRISAEQQTANRLANFAFYNTDQLLALVDEETGIRGYVATGDSLFLDIYSKGIEQYRHDTSLLLAAGDLQFRPDLEARKGNTRRLIDEYFRAQQVLLQTGQRTRAVRKLSAGKELFDDYRLDEATLDAAIAEALTSSRRQISNTRAIFENFALIATLLFGAIGARFAFVLRTAAQIERYAARDQLTGIGNRRTLLHSIKMEITGIRDGDVFAVALLDLDGFKAVNDTFGHAAGDQVLRDVATQLMGELRGGDSVARLGGDEFALVLKGVDTTHSPAIVARLQRAVETQSPSVAGFPRIGASIGLGFYPRDGDDAVSLLKSADRAMYEAKRTTKHASSQPKSVEAVALGA